MKEVSLISSGSSDSSQDFVLLGLYFLELGERRETPDLGGVEQHGSDNGLVD